MSFASRFSRCRVVILAGLLALGLSASPLLAAEPTACTAGATVPAALVGGMMDGVVGNRQRMTQFAFVGFGIGVLILVTATRKH
jgi:hypothetical protein